MKLRYFLRGLGAGIAFTAIVMGISGNAGEQVTLTDNEIIARARALGMITKEEKEEEDLNGLLQSLEQTETSEEEKNGIEENENVPEISDDSIGETNDSTVSSTEIVDIAEQVEEGNLTDEEIIEKARELGMVMKAEDLNNDVKAYLDKKWAEEQKKKDAQEKAAAEKKKAEEEKKKAEEQAKAEAEQKKAEAEKKKAEEEKKKQEKEASKNKDKSDKTEKAETVETENIADNKVKDNESNGNTDEKKDNIGSEVVPVE